MTAPVQDTPTTHASHFHGPDNPYSPPAHPDTGISLTTQTPIDPIATIPGDTPITDMWAALLSHPAMQTEFITCVRNAARQLSPAEFDELLDGAGISDSPLHGSYRALLRRTARGHTDAAWSLLTETRSLGTGHTTRKDIIAAARLYQYREDSPERVEVSIDHDQFRDQSRAQREDTLSLIAELSDAYEVHIVTGRVTQAYLATTHRDDLPGICVSEQSTTHHNQAHVTDALATLEPDTTNTTILTELRNAPGHVHTYSHLYGHVETTESRVRQCVSTLKALSLVEVYGPANHKKISLTPAGISAIDEIHAQFGTQSTLESEFGVRAPPKSSRQRRERPTPAGRGATAKTQQDSRPPSPPHRSRPTSEADTGEHAQPASESSGYASAFMSQALEDGLMGAHRRARADVTVLESPVVAETDSKTRFVGFESETETAMVSVHATNPLDFTVSLAIALASPGLLDEVVTPTRFDEMKNTASESDDLLRLARHIGYATEDVLSTPADLKGMISSWGESIEEQTRMLKRGEYGECSDRGEFVSELVKDSHGLAGSVVHVFDAMGVEIVRDIRIPAGLNREKVESLAVSMGYSLLIQSAYDSERGSFTGYRQLVEDRATKRDVSYMAGVDSSEPFGRVIGSVVLRGGSSGRAASALEQVLSEDDEDAEFSVVADAPEFGVPVSVSWGASRSVWRDVISRALGRKALHLRGGRVETALSTVFASPIECAHGLWRLTRSDATGGRAVSDADLWFVIDTVPTEWLLTTEPRSAAAILKAVGRLSRGQGGAGEVTHPGEGRGVLTGEVADEADISPQTARNRRDAVVESGLVSVSDTGEWVAIGVSSDPQDRAGDAHGLDVAAQESHLMVGSVTQESIVARGSQGPHGLPDKGRPESRPESGPGASGQRDERVPGSVGDAGTGVGGDGGGGDGDGEDDIALDFSGVDIEGSLWKG